MEYKSLEILLQIELGKAQREDELTASPKFNNIVFTGMVLACQMSQLHSDPLVSYALRLMNI